MNGWATFVVIFSGVVGTMARAEDTSVATPESTSQEEASSGLPGEYPERRFRSPFPAPVGKKSNDFDDQYLFGDWFGARTALADRGIRPTLLFISDPFANLAGGRRRGATDYNLLGGDLLIKMQQLGAWSGGEFHLGFAANFGTSLSENYVGNSFPVQLADVADTHVRLTYLSYTQALFGETISVRIGRLTINSVYGEEFLGSEYFKAFTSVGMDLVPLGVFLNAPGAFGYPDTTWGARIKVEPIKQFYAMAGAYNGDPGLKAGEEHGVDFSIHGPLFVIGEIGLRRNYGKDAVGLASNLKLGADYDGGRYGLYLLGDQEVLRWGDAKKHQHLGAFGALVVTPDWNANPLPVFFDSGLVLYGPWSRRPRDFVGVAVAYGRYQGDRTAIAGLVGLQTRDFEMTVEWTYGLKLVAGLTLQPDLQYVIHPSGTGAIANALVIGLNIIITL
jgi:porin